MITNKIYKKQLIQGFRFFQGYCFSQGTTTIQTQSDDSFAGDSLHRRELAVSQGIA